MGPTLGRALACPGVSVSSATKLKVPPVGDASLGRAKLLLCTVACQASVPSREELQGLAILAQGEGDAAARMVGITKIPVLIEDPVVPRRDEGLGRNFKLPQVHDVVSQEPAPDVYGEPGLVVEFDPVGRQVMRVREDLIDDHFAMIDHVPSIIPTGGTAQGGTGAPPTAAAQVAATGPQGTNRQGKAVPVGDPIPTPLIRKVLNRLSRRVDQRKAFSAVVEAALVLSRHRQVRAIDSCKGIDVIGDQSVSARRKVDGVEGKANAIVELHEI